MIKIFKEDTEDVLLLDLDLLEKITHQIEILGYNVMFKIHPVQELTKNKIHSKFRHIDLSKYGKISKREDDRHIDYYTDLGIIAYKSSFNFNSYLFDIPILRISNDNKDLEYNLQRELKNRCSLDEVCYGSFTTLNQLISNTHDVLDKFIKEYGHHPDFKYKDNNALYGTSYIDTYETWVNYIKTIMEKPLKQNDYVLNYPHRSVDVTYKSDKFKTVNDGWLFTPEISLIRPKNGFCDTNNDTYVNEISEERKQLIIGETKNRLWIEAAKRANMTLSEYRQHRKKIREEKRKH